MLMSFAVNLYNSKSGKHAKRMEMKQVCTSFSLWFPIKEDLPTLVTTLDTLANNLDRICGGFLMIVKYLKLQPMKFLS